MAMVIITATQIVPAIKAAVRAGFTTAEVPTIVGGSSGTFDIENLPKPALVIAANNEQNVEPPVTRNGMKSIRITVHGYTEFYGQEVGILGDAHTLGLYPIMDRVELILDNNVLPDELGANLVGRAHLTEKNYPDPEFVNYPGLNEGRALLEYFAVDPKYR